MITKDIIVIVEELVKGRLGLSFKEILPLQASGSPRSYYRVKCEGGSVILCFSLNREENSTFIKLDRIFRANGIKVPEILAASEDLRSYILQDLGDVQLLDIIKREKLGIDRQGLIEGSLCQLRKLQFMPREKWIESVEFEPLGEELIMYDFNYSLSQFISRFNIRYDNNALKNEFESLKERLLDFPKELWGFMYRDFQSRNVLIYENEPWFIDFQSGRLGPCIYDFVSFAWQARAGFSKEDKQEMLQFYSRQLERVTENPAGILNENMPYWVTFRLLQVLGAYGLRGLKEGKPHFIASITPALKEFTEMIEENELQTQYPVLSNIINDLNVEWSKRN